EGHSAIVLQPHAVILPTGNGDKVGEIRTQAYATAPVHNSSVGAIGEVFQRNRSRGNAHRIRQSGGNIRFAVKISPPCHNATRGTGWKGQKGIWDNRKEGGAALATPSRSGDEHGVVALHFWAKVGAHQRTVGGT